MKKLKIGSSYILITNKTKGKVFEIKNNGSVWYICKGKYQEADTDKKLGIALGEALKTLVKLNEDIINKQNKTKM